ncbi:MAG TPA: ABC transporter substrate-binding protein [Terriglobales bacterium]|nr:ABC transporter substrate-binding protein [Terriglobales bacterium]
MKKRILALLLAFVLAAGMLAGCRKTPAAIEPKPDPETREFTDSTGRTVTIPYEVTKIAVSGPLTQVYVLPLAGDMLVGVSNAFAVEAKTYLPAYLFELTEVGQLYGGKSEMDLEALLAAAPDVVVDVGDAKATIVEDMDALTTQTGIPFVHIDATVKTAPEAYRMLGELLGRPEEAEALAGWCETTYADIAAMMAAVDAAGARKSLLYCLGDKGLNVIAEGSYHAETVNLMGDNAAKLADVVSSGMGNEVDLEQIMVWDPDVVLFAPDSIYDTVTDDAAWQELPAIAAGAYYKTPALPYGWLSSPPSVQRYLGMLWLGSLLYPDYADYDLKEKVTGYYKTFYDCELTDEMYAQLTAGALPK